MLYPPERWFCCLNPIEAEMTFLVAGGALPVFPFIQEDVFRALWTVSGGALDTPRFDAYTSLYTVGLVELEFEGELLDFYQIDIINLVEWQLFFASGGRDCEDGCNMRPAWTEA